MHNQVIFVAMVFYVTFTLAHVCIMQPSQSYPNMIFPIDIGSTSCSLFFAGPQQDNYCSGSHFPIFADYIIKWGTQATVVWSKNLDHFSNGSYFVLSITGQIGSTVVDRITAKIPDTNLTDGSVYQTNFDLNNFFVKSHGQPVLASVQIAYYYTYNGTFGGFYSCGALQYGEQPDSRTSGYVAGVVIGYFILMSATGAAVYIYLTKFRGSYTQV